MEKAALTPDSSVRELPGVGDARAAAFARMGILTLRDLIYRLPRSYENRGRIHLLKDGLGGEPTSFLLTVATEPRTVNVRRGMTLTKFRAFDDSGSVEIVFFNCCFAVILTTFSSPFSPTTVSLTVLSPYAPTLRFSSTVSSAKRSLPSGDFITPAFDTL